MRFEVGDLVKLKDNAGPLMTVSKVYRGKQTIRCIWCKDREIKSCDFPEEDVLIFSNS